MTAALAEVINLGNARHDRVGKSKNQKKDYNNSNSTAILITMAPPPPGGPLEQMAQAAPGLVPADRPPSTFNQLFGDETRDPCKQDYRQVMVRFDASRDNAIAGDVQFQQAG